MGAADRVANILGLSEARTILDGIDRDDRAGEIARQNVQAQPQDIRQGLALIEMAHALENTHKLAESAHSKADALQRAHDEQMAGKGQSCRFLADLEAKFYRYIVVTFVASLGAWALIEVVAWRLKH